MKAGPAVFLLLFVTAGLFVLAVVQKKEEARVRRLWMADIAAQAAMAESAREETQKIAARADAAMMESNHSSNALELRTDRLQDRRLEKIERMLRLASEERQENARADSSRQDAIEAQARMLQRLRNQIGR